MRGRKKFLGVLSVCALLTSALAGAQDAVRFSEIHYDNVGTDAAEAIEVSGPAGLDVTGWQVLLYNGSNGALYDTKTLSGPIPASCGSRGVVVINYPANGIQNGSPDAMALVNAGGAVIEYLSYEGTMAAVGGAADGLTSVDIGVQEPGTGPVGESLARKADGSWNSSAAATFGACNDDGDTTPPPAVATVSVAPTSATVNVGATLSLAASAFDAGSQPIANVAFTWSSSAGGAATVSASGVVTGVAEGDAIVTATAPNGVAGSMNLHVNTVTTPPASAVHVSEIHYDNAGTDVGEAIEIEGPVGTDLAGYSVVLYNGDGGAAYGTTPLTGVLAATCADRGVFVINYPANGIQNGSPDGIALVNGAGTVVEFLSYEGVLTATGGPAAGMSSFDIGASENSAAIGLSLQRDSESSWTLAAATVGACNEDAPTPGGNTVSFTGPTPFDPALPVGFEQQLFARLADTNNTTIPTTFVWSSETPAIASIDQNGVMHALGAGAAILRATAADGTTATTTLPTRVPVAGTTAQYAGNAEFGEPADGDPRDDFIVRYDQYTASYSPIRNTPNWVSYDLDATHFGAEDRCNCFTMDPALPSSFTHLTTADYTGAGAFAGYGIDRGHLARSFDRTTGSLDNAFTYLFDNIVPQAADLNQGPWAILENFLGDEARNSNKEVYIIAGVAGNKGTVKDEGKIVIPTSTWKVAVILPRDQGLASIHGYRDLEVIAVYMPNEPGVRNVDWHTYITTVDAIEALSGYDLLALLPDDIEAAVESDTQPPIAGITGPATLNEGDTANYSAASSIDPNGSIASYLWDFGDGTTASGVSVTHTFAQDGTHVVSLLVTDNDGLTDTATFTVDVANVAPVVGALPNATLNAGGAYTAAGSFVDPGADNWTATVNWGDGSSPSQSALGGHDFSLVHVYGTAGTYIVAVTIADDDTSSSVTNTVTVNAVSPVLAPAIALVDQLVASRKISRDVGKVLKAELAAAQALINRGKNAAASLLLKATVIEIDLLVRLRVVAAADVAPLRNLLTQIIGTLR
ncbi:MAG TPA: DNA/RNA non-specific endonuclease [Steroidobacteraceae bacterium]|nr:DNA/RNA non-specific endonuclease [Steroidobacteraceae bacterium]